jgi:flagellin
VSDLLNAINNGSVAGLSAYLNASGYLVIQSTAGSVNISSNTVSEVGTLTGTPNTVGDLMNAINTSNKGLTANLVGGKLQITSSVSGGPISALTSTLSALGTMSPTNTVQDLMNWVNGLGVGLSAGLASVSGETQLQITDTENRGDLTVTNYDSVLGSTGGGTPSDAFVAPTTTGGTVNVFVSDGTVGTHNTVSVSIANLASTSVGNVNLSTQSIGSSGNPTAALTAINNAISGVASERGTIGAGINRLNSAVNVLNVENQNLSSAESSIQDANVGQVVANLSKYQVLEQTGISALAQANTQEQIVLKLLQ